MPRQVRRQHVDYPIVAVSFRLPAPLARAMRIEAADRDVTVSALLVDALCHPAVLLALEYDDAWQRVRRQILADYHLVGEGGEEDPS